MNGPGSSLFATGTLCGGGMAGVDSRSRQSNSSTVSSSSNRRRLRTVHSGEGVTGAVRFIP
jgi:hypothetical protein